MQGGRMVADQEQECDGMAFVNKHHQRSQIHKFKSWGGISITTLTSRQIVPNLLISCVSFLIILLFYVCYQNGPAKSPTSSVPLGINNRTVHKQRSWATFPVNCSSPFPRICHAMPCRLVSPCPCMKTCNQKSDVALDE
jgi:hypothetical protein